MSGDQVSKERYLGESVFCIGRDGRIARTVVSKLSVPRHSKKKMVGDGSTADFLSLMDTMLDREAYELLNHHNGLHYFSLSDAIRDAIPILERYIERTDISKAVEQSAREYLAEIQTTSGRGVILSAPLIKVSGTVFLKDSPINPDAAFPVEYFKPGETVFCLITPRTHYTLVPAWRPHLYFILETTVTEVSYAPAWPSRLHYSFEGTHYQCSHNALCSTEAEARTRMTEVFTAETDGTIDPDKLRLLPVALEVEYWDVARRKMMASERYRPAP